MRARASTVTQEAIARQLGISRSVVAKALHDQLNTQVNPQRRQSIVQAARSLGYVPHQAGRRLARSRTASRATNFDQVGLIYFGRGDLLQDNVYLAMMSGAEQTASRLHASLTCVRVTEPGDWTKVERLAQARGVDGWLVYGPIDDATANRLRSTTLPYVILGDHQCTQPVSSVNVDNMAVGQLAVQHLAARGHRRIAYMAGKIQLPHEREMLAGFRQARRDLGLAEDEQLIINMDTWGTSPTERSIGWMQNLQPMPTAVFFPALGTALGLCPIFKQSTMAAVRNLDVIVCASISPQEVGQNFPCVQLPMTEVGRQGAFRLHQLATGQEVASSELRIPPAIIAESFSTQATNERSIP